MGTSARAPVFVEFRATGIDQVRSGMRLLRSEGEASGGKIAHSAQSAASAIAEISRAGEAGGRSLNELIKSGAEMALAFGAGGPILGAIGLLGLTFYNVFNRAREEMKKTRETAIEEMERLRGSTDFADVQKSTQRLFSGDPNAIRHVDETNEDFLKRRFGLQGINSRIDRLSSGLPDDVLQYVLKNGKLPSLIADAPGATARDAKELAKLLPIQKALTDQYNEAATALGKVTQQLVGKTQAEIDARKKEDAPKELADEIANLKALADMQQMTGADVRRAADLQKQFTRELAGGNLTLKQRVQLERDLATVTAIANPLAALGALPGVRDPLQTRTQLQAPQITGMLKGIGQVNASQITETIGDSWAEAYANFLKALPDEIKSGLADAVSAGLVAGITAGFQKGANFGSVAGALTGAILEQVGAVAIAVGTQLLTMATFIAKIEAHLIANPFEAIAVAVGLIAFGALLEGAGSRIASGSAPGSGGAGFAGLSDMPQIIDRGFINTTSSAARGVAPQQSVTQNITIVGTDPKAWRQIQAQLDKSAARSGRKL